MPVDLERFAGRPFSFYPPILNVEHNEWVYEEQSWSELRIRNVKTGSDLWMPRRYLGEISQVEKPVMIVGLIQELVYKGGMLVPHRRRVVEMPGVGAPAPVPGALTPPPPKPKSKGSKAEQRIGQLIVACLAVFVLAAVLAVFITRGRETGGRINYEAVLQAEVGLTGADDYFAVVRKLGEPADDRWRPNSSERQYRALEYPDLGITVILMGAEQDDARYIGAKDEEWRTVHSVRLPGGGTTDSIVRNLPEF